MSAKDPNDFNTPIEVDVPMKTWGWIKGYCPHCRKNTLQELRETIHDHKFIFMGKKLHISKFHKCDTCGQYYRVAAKKSDLTGKK